MTREEYVSSTLSRAQEVRFMHPELRLGQAVFNIIDPKVTKIVIDQADCYEDDSLIDEFLNACYTYIYTWDGCLGKCYCSIHENYITIVKCGETTYRRTWASPTAGWDGEWSNTYDTDFISTVKCGDYVEISEELYETLLKKCLDHITESDQMSKAWIDYVGSVRKQLP